MMSLDTEKRMIDLGMIRDASERSRVDSQMITNLCDTIFSLNKENQDLKARVASLQLDKQTDPIP